MCKKLFNKPFPENFIVSTEGSKVWDWVSLDFPVYIAHGIEGRQLRMHFVHMWKSPTACELLVWGMGDVIIGGQLAKSISMVGGLG